MADPATAPPPAAGLDTEFQRGLGLFDATMVVVGSMIGSGIFLVSAAMAREVGSPGWLLVAWLVTGVLTVTAALSYGELAALMPRAGGQYVYLREAFSPLWGFLYGWTLFLVIQTGTIAAVGVAFAKFLGVLVPALGTGPEAELFRLGDFHLHWTLPLPWLQEPLVAALGEEGVGVVELLLPARVGPPVGEVQVAEQRRRGPGRSLLCVTFLHHCALRDRDRVV